MATEAGADNRKDNKGPLLRAGEKGALSTTTAIINRGLGKMEGVMWTWLVEYHLCAGDFKVAQLVYEEAFNAILSVRDFSLVFNAYVYVKSKEGVIEALVELMEEEERWACKRTKTWTTITRMKCPRGAISRNLH
jgi:hypothetical protein